MSIQSGVNQLISQVAGLSVLGKGVKELGEVKKEVSGIRPELRKTYEKQIEEAKTKPVSPAVAKALQEIAGRIDNAKPGSLKPVTSLGTFESYTAKPDLSASEREAAKRALAMQSMATKGSSKIKQKRNFADYLKGLKTSIGNYESLDPKIQKQILASYSKTERKKIMDTADKEKN